MGSLVMCDLVSPRSGSICKRTRSRERRLIVDTLGLVLVLVMATSASARDRAGGRRVLQRLAKCFGAISSVLAEAAAPTPSTTA